MSEESKPEILDVMVSFITELDKTGAIDMGDLIDQLPVEEDLIIVIRPVKKNHNVSDVLDAMLRADKVFITAINSRQQLSYLRRQVEDESELKVKTQEARFEGERGYLISFIE